MADQESPSTLEPLKNVVLVEKTGNDQKSPSTPEPVKSVVLVEKTGNVQKSPSTLEPVKNIVLVGKTGNGKSSTGNTLLNDKQFVSKKSAGGVTMKCEMLRAATKDGPIINVIDTPGLFDLEVSAEILSKEIVTCLSMAEEGIHAVLFVLSTRGRITQEEESTLNALQRIFECKILDYFIVVFTGGDDCEEDGQTLDDYLRENCPQFLTNVLRLCGQRKVLFNNKTKDEDKKAKQLQQLLAHIKDVERQTGGIPYTDNMHKKIKEENDKVREQKREIEAKNLAEEESKKLQEKLQIQHDHDMKMLAITIETTLKQSVAAHEKEMRQVEVALKQNAIAHEKEIRQVEDVLKQNALTHEREMRQMKDEFQQNQQLQHLEDVVKQNAAAHEKEIRQMREEHQRNQAAQQHQQTQLLQMAQQQAHQQPHRGPVPECNIM